MAAGDLERSRGLLWVVMITSAENRSSPEDVAVSDLTTAGLPAPSVVRSAKIATIEARNAERIGALPRADRRKVARHLGKIVSAAVSTHR